MRRWLALFVPALLVGACEGTRQPTGPAFVEDSCGVFGDPPAPITGWIPADDATCVSAGDPHLQHDPPALYDDCEPPDSYSYDLCSGTAPSRSFCEGTGPDGRAGRLLALCVDDADCPDGAICVRLPGLELAEYGQCEARCNVDSDCVRCELTCDRHRHVCGPDPVPPPPPLPAP